MDRTMTLAREMKPSASGRVGMTSEARWLSIREIAGDLGVSTSTAYKWSARGAPWFPRSIRLHNGDIRVRSDWYETWLGDLER
jgi:predicted DNA-binding transcriptional regulator AlpA